MPPVPIRHDPRLGEEGRVNLVLDTNIVLDLFVFRDEAVAALHEAIANKKVEWFACAPMREELECVLAYEQIEVRMGAANMSAQRVLDAFDAHARIVDAAQPSKLICRDADDQKFIDLAVAHGCLLLSKDKRVLALDRRMRALGAAAAKPSAFQR
jgi:putative PIN family toxin of toxin-antitoxin system